MTHTKLNEKWDQTWYTILAEYIKEQIVDSSIMRIIPPVGRRAYKKEHNQYTKFDLTCIKSRNVQISAYFHVGENAEYVTKGMNG